jgi:hypothetical protein
MENKLRYWSDRIRFPHNSNYNKKQNNYFVSVSFAVFILNG